MIRATIKLATMRPEAIKKFEEYRKTMSDCAVAMLQNQLSKDISRDTVHVAMQMVLATVTDPCCKRSPD